MITKFKYMSNIINFEFIPLDGQRIQRIENQFNNKDFDSFYDDTHKFKKNILAGYDNKARNVPLASTNQALDLHAHLDNKGWHPPTQASSPINIDEDVRKVKLPSIQSDFDHDWKFGNNNPLSNLTRKQKLIGAGVGALGLGLVANHFLNPKNQT